MGEVTSSCFAKGALKAEQIGVTSVGSGRSDESAPDPTLLIDGGSEKVSSRLSDVFERYSMVLGFLHVLGL